MEFVQLLLVYFAGAVRSKLGKDLGLLNPAEFKFAWIVDFPLFEWNEEENKWDPAHHMFSAPQEKYIATMVVHSKAKPVNQLMPNYL